MPDVFSFTSAITACGSSAQWLLALAVFSEMSRASTTPNVFSFNAVMSSCDRPGHWERALELFAEMPAAMIEADSVSFNIGISAAETGFLLRGFYFRYHYGDLSYMIGFPYYDNLN